MNAKKIAGVVGMAVVWLAAVAPGDGQVRPGQKPLMAEDVFKNVQVLRGIPVNEFMETMGFFSASLSLNCTDCHVAQSLSSWEKYAEDIPLKRTARRMVAMVNVINKSNFGGQRTVTCNSCHRGNLIQHHRAWVSLSEDFFRRTAEPH